MLNPDLPNWMLPSIYKLVGVIGKGTFGLVCAAKYTNNDELVAIKEIKNIFTQYQSAKRLVREVSIMRFLNHPSIIKIKDIRPSSKFSLNSAYIVMELAPTDLRNYAKQSNPPIFLNQNEIKSFIYQAICGCRYMHSADIFHRDIKPGNILISFDGKLKICDFGLSRSYQDLNINSQSTETSDMEVEEEAGNERDFSRSNKIILSDMVGSMYYIAPEMILSVGEYGKEVDVWSLGCVFAELLGMNSANCELRDRCPFFEGQDSLPLPQLPPEYSLSSLGVPRKRSRENGDLNLAQWNQICRIIEKLGTPLDDDLSFVSNPITWAYTREFPQTEPVDFHEYFCGASEEEIDLLSRLLTFSPSKRITLDQALEHPYFRDIRDSRLETLAPDPANFIVDREEPLDMNTLKAQFRREIERYETGN